MQRSGNKLRALFLDYFKAQGHRIFPSSSLIPAGDPSLLFTSAGMVPFKPYFLGIKKDVSRAVSCQRSFRTTDIDRVGTTVRHFTFFEMLGNFSFGDYFKEEAIAWAWTFLTREAGVDPMRLHVTVYREDDEAEALWKAQPLAHPVARLGEESNFWNMGPTGPCGPCSEIYFDRGPEFSCGKPSCSVGCDCDRYFEVWNLVFTQFDRQEDGSLKPLPRKNIDTGMGLERLALVVQGKPSALETDLFLPITEAASKVLGKDPDENPETRLAFRVICDHSRAAVFLASEGIVPSNEGRGYVLRRLIRRAARYGRLLGHKGPFVHKLVPSVLDIFEGVYEEPSLHKKAIEETLKTEEEHFLETIETGEKLLGDLLEHRPSVLPGDAAFKLYDTYGFPLEMTREIAGQRGVRVDDQGFEAARVAAQETARAGWKGSGEKAVSRYQTLSEKTPPTRFLGYETLELKSKVLSLLDGEGRIADSLHGPQNAEIILDRTPFYAEGGGQVGDRGNLLDKDGQVVARILDTHIPVPGIMVHKAEVLGTIKVGMEVSAQVDPGHRIPTMCHHTATHLLNEALRRVLGLYVRQAGSLVTPDKLRFDYTTPKPTTPEELARVEALVNDAIVKDLLVRPEIRTLEEARGFGAVCLIGEKYSERPRCVLIGPKDWEAGGVNPKTRYSLELCGGSHVHHTGEILFFKILKESSIASGIRRVEAVAGPAALRYFTGLDDRARAIARKLEVPVEKLEEKVDALLKEQKKLRDDLGALKHKLLSGGSAGKKRREGDSRKWGAPFSYEPFTGEIEVDIAYLRDKVDATRKTFKSGLICAAGTKAGKLAFVVSASPDCIEKGSDAVKVARAISAEFSGSAGGRPDFAQGGGKEVPDWESKLEKLLE